jgi:hypothetical protein
MSVTGPDERPETAPLASGVSPGARLAAEIARLRASGVFGAGGRLSELFDFLVARSAEGRPPKEAEIALEVFGKADADAMRDDPVARVYIHRLRKRLDDFYLRNGTNDGYRIDIPRGEYRIVGAEASVAPAALAADTDDETAARLASGPAAQPRKRNWMWAAAAGFVAVMLVGNIAAWAMLRPKPAPVVQTFKQSPVWASMAQSKRPLTVVVGDYYIFGEYQDRVFLKRLIRDFAINSKDDLLRRSMSDKDGRDKYSDVALQYLPTSAAFALTDLAPLIEGRQVDVQLASELTPDKLKTNDIIYIGWLSGMGSLRELAFARSRFKIGESYDTIVDRASGEVFTSEAFLAAPSDTMYRDYGYFSTFHGPEGNTIAIIAGARDTALMGVAETMTQRAALDGLRQEVGQDQDFEAVFEVKGQKHVNLETRMLASSPVDSKAVWQGTRKDPLEFPRE